MSDEINPGIPPRSELSVIDKLILFCLENKFIMALVAIGMIVAGIIFAPFDWDIKILPRHPVAVDAIPDIGENQQIVFTEWEGRSPRDVENQITYPLTSYLTGMPGVKTIRSTSMFSFSFIYIIFNDKTDFFWARSRVLEKLNSLPMNSLPVGVKPILGPDATGVGQIFWYTLEGRDPYSKPVGGWDLQELRSIQDWQVRYALLSAADTNNNKPISEVASVGGFVKEYQVDVDPDAMRAYDVMLQDVFMAIKASNVDVGARTIEVNRVDYIIRGLGFIKSIEDIETTVIKVNENVPIRVKDVAKVSFGPALREGVLDKEGTEAVGAVVVVRYGENPLTAIKAIKEKIKEISPGLPKKAVINYSKVTMSEVEEFAKTHGFQAYNGVELNNDGWLAYLRTASHDKWPKWVTTSQVTVVPFYDRTGLIYETLGTLNEAITQQILITIIVIVVMILHLRSSILISALMPMAVLMTFIGMKIFGVDANIVALSGIAIAIGEISDMGIIICENILNHLNQAPPGRSTLATVFKASREVGGAVVAAVSTTIVSFLPVFAMTGAEGKLFKPLAYTKTFALLASIIIALTIVPPAAHLLFTRKISTKKMRNALMGGLICVGIITGFWLAWWAGAIIAALGTYEILQDYMPSKIKNFKFIIINGAVVLLVGILLTIDWVPLGAQKGFLRNLLFVGLLITLLQGFFYIMQRTFGPILRILLDHKMLFLIIPFVVIAFGAIIFFSVGKEFMPDLHEGSFLYMPTTGAHASIAEALDVMQKQDIAIRSIPEVESVVGKLGRVESALDPAPINMFETVVTYKSEYRTDEDGRRLTFRYDRKKKDFIRDEKGELIPDKNGYPYREWRDEIKHPDDIWKEIEIAAQVPGTTGAPKLSPIKTRVIMLQTGMRAPMGVKIKGPNLESIEKFGFEIERLLKEVPSVDATKVVADRIVGSPYIEIDIKRDEAARYGLAIMDIQNVIEVAIGGMGITTTVEGRERYVVRARYMRELRDQPDTLGKILIPTKTEAQIPLEMVADIRYVRGPMQIKSEDTFLTGYVLFDKKPEFAEVDVVEDCKKYLKGKEDSGELLASQGVHYNFSGNYENQVRSQKTLMIVLPLTLFLIFIILYLQLRRVLVTLNVFSGVFICWAGGFILIWLYAQPWFLDLSLFGTSMRELFQVHQINLSIAIWVGFLALFGIACDDGVVMATYLDQTFEARIPNSIKEIRETTVVGGQRRIRPCLMTEATTILALLPVFTSYGRGSEIMVPMAIPAFGGMLVGLLTEFTTPVLYCALKEFNFKRQLRKKDFDSPVSP